jgi:hypothetical protein
LLAGGTEDAAEGMMTGKIGSAISAKVVQRIAAPTGAQAGLALLTVGVPAGVPPFMTSQIRSQNVAADLVERSQTVQYPTVHVYCEKIANSLTEKFRTFSGTVQMAIEIRYSQDRLDGLQDGLELYSDAVMQVLDASRGDWSDGMYYCGGYQVAFGAVKSGGRNYIQVAKVTFEIGVSIN